MYFSQVIIVKLTKTLQPREQATGSARLSETKFKYTQRNEIYVLISRTFFSLVRGWCPHI